MRRRFLLALLFAWLLPLAQVAAAAHEVSHVRALDQGAPATVHCDLCVAAAAVSGGAATAGAPVLAHAPNPAAPIAFDVPAAPERRHIALFLSRAPPFTR
jgi:hypothetical protein